MSQRKRPPEQLQALQRWHESELEAARVKLTQLHAEVAARFADLRRIQDEIAGLQELAREQMRASAPLSTDALQRMTTFSSHQQKQLHGARDLHREVTERADDAQRCVLHLFQQLSLVERLLERRHDADMTEQQRTLQKQLDEGALARVPQLEHN
jgi:hypothetical protein